MLVYQYQATSNKGNTPSALGNTYNSNIVASKCHMEHLMTLMPLSGTPFWFWDPFIVCPPFRWDPDPDPNPNPNTLTLTLNPNPFFWDPF